MSYHDDDRPDFLWRSLESVAQAATALYVLFWIAVVLFFLYCSL